MRAHRAQYAFAAILLALPLLAIVPSAALGGGLKQASKRPQVARFALEDLKGRRVKLSSHKGKVLVVSFWATWCVPCKQELKQLQKLRKKLKKQGFEVLAISTDGPETFSGVRGFVKRHRLEMPVLVDRDGSFSAFVNPRGSTPFTLLVDRKGRVAWTHEGYAKGDEVVLKKHVESLLAEPAQ